MNIREMHHNFKAKFNKLDSQLNRNFLIPEIDAILNEAQEIYVKIKCKDSHPYRFQISSQNMEDLQTHIVKDFSIPNIDNNISLPENYWFFIKGIALAEKGECKERKIDLFLRNHRSEFENSEFDKSSFEWKTLNTTLANNKLCLYVEDFLVKEVSLTYFRKLEYINFASGHQGGYQMLDGRQLTGTQDCMLPTHTHREIVDLGVLIASGQLNPQDYNIKKEKIQIDSL